MPILQLFHILLDVHFYARIFAHIEELFRFQSHEMEMSVNLINEGHYLQRVLKTNF